MYKCPFCHSNKISKEGDFNEFKGKIKEIMETEESKELPTSLKRAFNDLLLYDMYDDEQYLKNLEEHGLTLICDDCGTIFKEKDEINEENFVMPSEITKEEFYDILIKGIEENKNEMPETVLLDKDEFISGLCDKRKKYYKEKAYEMIEDLLVSIRLMNEFSFDNEGNDEEYIS